jgi:Concanavalin A-like lectin/glucanases superfamily
MKSTRTLTTWKNKVLPFVAALVLAGVRTASAVDYPTTILADNPVAYYRFEETSGTVAADSSASHAYPGVYNDNGAFPFLGWPAIDTNGIAEASSLSPDYVSVGYYDALNQPGPFSFEVWARPISVPTGGNYRCPIGNSPAFGTATQSGWYVYQTPDVPSEFALVTPTGDVFIQTTNYTIFNWYHLAGTYDGTNMSFYVNGVLIGMQKASAYVANSVANAQACTLSIGQRGDGYGNFDGELDEAAYYTNTLTLAQIQAHYQAGTNMFRNNTEPPLIFTAPASASFNSGQTAKFSVLADGATPLSYQWLNGASAISGATNSAYSFTCADSDNGSTFSVIITNVYGAVTSSPATLTVLASLQIDAQLTSIIRNVGSSAAFEVVAEGAPPITYQWHNGDGSIIPGQTNSVLWLTNVQASADGSSYYVSVINPQTSVDSFAATLNVQARPITVPITGYAKIVAADGAVALWRLDETNGSPTAVDALGSFDGAYLTNLAGIFTYGEPTGIPHETNAALGITAGPYAGVIPQGETTGATISIPYSIEINPVGAFTVEGWFNASSATAGGNDYRVPFSSISNPYGAGPSGWLVYQTSANNWSWWPYSGFYAGGQLTDNDQVVPNQWYYLTLVYDGTTFTFYVNGVAKASGTVPGFTQNGNVPDTAAGPANYNYNYNVTPGLPSYNGIGSGSFVIGQRFDNAFNPFMGIVDDVAVYNKALTLAQIQNHFLNTTHLSIISSGTNIVVSWPVGTLQSAPAVTGPYTTVSGATSPYTNSISGSQKFFRTQL